MPLTSLEYSNQQCFGHTLHCFRLDIQIFDRFDQPACTHESFKWRCKVKKTHERKNPLWDKDENNKKILNNKILLKNVCKEIIVLKTYTMKQWQNWEPERREAWQQRQKGRGHQGQKYTASAMSHLTLSGLWANQHHNLPRRPVPPQ